jgi:hypothetical protein
VATEPKHTRGKENLDGTAAKTETNQNPLATRTETENEATVKTTQRELKKNISDLEEARCELDFFIEIKQDLYNYGGHHISLI